MKNIFFKFLLFSLMISAAACEKQSVAPLVSTDTPDTSWEKKAKYQQVLAVGIGLHGLVQTADDCLSGGSGCTYTDFAFRAFDGSLEEAIQFVDGKSSEECVVRISLESDDVVNIELVYATAGYEKRAASEGIDFSSFKVGPEDAFLAPEISQALGKSMISLQAGTYKVMREATRKYWNGQVSVPSRMAPLLLLSNIEGGATCAHPVADAYGAHYELDPVTYNFYYLNNWPHGLDVEVQTTGGTTVLSEFDAACLDPDRFRTTLTDFTCNSIGLTKSLSRNTTYRFRLHIAGYPASSPWYYFTTPNSLPCGE